MSLTTSLSSGEVHIWTMDLDDSAWDSVSHVLNQEEREKSARFYTEKLRRHYSRCRGALRTILSRYASRSAASLQFQYGKFGKPELPGVDWHFNLSHSGNHAVFAISPHQVGVDIEFMAKDRIDLGGLIDMVCHPIEKTELSRLSDAEKLSRFYQLWTQKESYCKLVGLGLQQAVDVLHFTPTAIDSVKQLQITNSGSASTYFAHRMDIVDGYAASVCLPLQEIRLSVSAATPC